MAIILLGSFGSAYQHLVLYLCAGFIFMIFTFLGTWALDSLHRRVKLRGYS